MTGIAADNLVVRRNGATLPTRCRWRWDDRLGCRDRPNGAGKSTLLKVLAGYEKRPRARSASAVATSPRFQRAAAPPRSATCRSIFDPHWDLTVAELVRIGASAASGCRPAPSSGRPSGSSSHIGAAALVDPVGRRARARAARHPCCGRSAGATGRRAGASLDIRPSPRRDPRVDPAQQRHLSVGVVHDSISLSLSSSGVIVVDRGRIVAEWAGKSLIDDRRIGRGVRRPLRPAETPDGWLLRAATGRTLIGPRRNG